MEGILGILSNTDDPIIDKLDYFLNVRSNLIDTEINGKNLILGKAPKRKDYKIVEGKDCIAVIDGEWYKYNLDDIFKLFLEGDFKKVFNLNGDFSFAFTDGNFIYLGRDIVGIKPLYFSRDREVFAFSSMKSILWDIGLKNVKRVKPGKLLKVDPTNRKINISNISDITSLNTKNKVDIKRSSIIKKKIRKYINRSIKRRVEKNVAIAFSGGIDSTIVATLASKFADVKLYTVGLSDSPDVNWSKEASKYLNLEHKVIEMDISDISRYIPLTLKAIGRVSRLDIGIGLPLYVASEAAFKDGYDTMLSGQGSDELFGGYDKFKKSKKPEKTILKSVKNIANRDIERDAAVMRKNSIQHRAPFLDQDVIRLALSIPWKIKNNKIEKQILREAFKGIVPKKILKRNKKSLQYGSRVDREIDRIARRNGYKRRMGKHVERYLNQIAEELFPPEILEEIRYKTDD